MNIETLLSEEIQDEIEELGGLELGSEEYKVSADGITKLTGQLIELKKINMECEDKKASREDEYKFKREEMLNEQRDRLIKNCLTGASIITGIGLTVWGVLVSLDFEKEGTVTTIVGRGFINKLLPKK